MILVFMKMILSNQELFETHLRDTLFELKTVFDKSLVNMILIFKVSDIYQISLQSQYCRDIQDFCHQSVLVRSVILLTELQWIIIPRYIKISLIRLFMK